MARRISYRKPVLCVKGARSRAGGDVARAHIAAVAQSDANVEMLFRQAGVIRADKLEEMFDVAALLASQPLPRGNRVGITSNSGGVLTICADACDSHGLAVPAGAAVDLGPLVAVDAYERAVQATLERDDVDALIAIHACIGDCDPNVVGRAIRRGIRRAERETGVSKPALLCLIGGIAGEQAQRDDGTRAAGSRRVFPSYRFPESAALALSRAVQYSAFRSRPAGRLRWFEDVDAASARQEIAAMFEGAAGDTLALEREAAHRIVRLFGIRNGTAASTETTGREGFRLEIRSDPSFGPLLRVERPPAPPVVRITPLTDNDIREIVEVARIPAGPGVEELLARVSQMIEELPWLAGMEAVVTPGADAAAAPALGADLRVSFHVPRASPTSLQAAAVVSRHRHQRGIEEAA